MALKLPTGELVAVAYGKLILAAAGQAAPVVTTLPDVATWSATGAVQVEGVVGSRRREQDLRDMVVSYGGWGAKPGSDKPPWGQANGLLEFIRSSGFDQDAPAFRLELEPAGVYRPVLVHAAFPEGEPRRLADPDTSRAHYSMDFRLMWTVA